MIKSAPAIATPATSVRIGFAARRGQRQRAVKVSGQPDC
jgi:hypothetical protein